MSCSLLERGFTLLHIRDELVGSSLLDKNFQGALPEFEEILADNLLYDIDDAQKVRVQMLWSWNPINLTVIQLLTTPLRFPSDDSHSLLAAKITDPWLHAAP